MKIAVASNDFIKVARHAGQARKWLVFEVPEGQTPVEVDRLELAPDQVFHHHKQGTNPLDGVSVLIAASAGEGFLRRMGKRGIEAVLTGEADARKAAADYLAGTLAPPRPPGVMGWICQLRDLFSKHR